MEKRRKKLGLHRETLAALETGGLREAIGGVSLPGVVCGSGAPLCEFTKVSLCRPC